MNTNDEIDYCIDNVIEQLRQASFEKGNPSAKLAHMRYALTDLSEYVKYYNDYFQE